MPNRILNGFARAWPSVPAVVQAPRPIARVQAPAAASRPRSAGVPGGRIGQRRAPTVAEARLNGALQRISHLQEREARLKAEVQHLRLSAAQAFRFAYHDELTGLPNRRMLADRIQQAAASGSAAWSPCCSWTWTASRRSTTPSGIAPATSCCKGSRPA